MLLYIFLFIAQNANVFNNNTVTIWVGMLFGIVVLYGIVFGILNNITNLELGIVGFKLSTLFFGLVIPISLFAYNQFIKKPTVTHASLLEKENIQLIVNNKACEKIKYGTFTNGTDTIIRFFEKNQDFELLKTPTQQFKNRIKWLDSCTYITLKNQSLIKYIKLGNFENEQHYRYCKPGNYHNISEESYEMILKIN